MDIKTVGERIRFLRTANNLTQKQLAEAVGVGDKAVSKWECGQGYPDIALLSDLAEFLQADLNALLGSNTENNIIKGTNMKQTKYYVCSRCQNISLCTGNAEVSCCGKKLAPMEAKKADENEKLKVEIIEDEYYITSNHPMNKEHYITFVAHTTGDRVMFYKQFPEWNLQLRMPKRGRGMLLWCCTNHGLFYQLL